MVSNLAVAALHAAQTVLVIGAGPLGEGVVAQPRHQGAVVVVPVRQGALSWLVMATIIIIMLLLVVVVVVMVVLWRMIVRNVLQCRLRL